MLAHVHTCAMVLTFGREQVKFGPMAGGVTLKADSSCYSKLGALDVILDIFRLACLHPSLACKMMCVYA